MEMNNYVTVANSGSALREDDIELELGLSVGGSYKKTEKLDHDKNGGHCKYSDDSVDVGLREKNPTCTRSSVSSSFIGHDGEWEMDPKTKRQIQALRRQEAKKKREEKQLRKGLCKGKNGALFNRDNEGMMVKGKEKDFVAEDQQQCKKIKIEDTGSDYSGKGNVNLNLSLPVHYPYTHPPLRYGPPSMNGFIYPCANVNVIPCWFPAKNVVQPEVGCGYGSFRAVSDPGHNLGSGYDSENNDSKDGGNRKSGSNRSSICSSPVGSDHNSSSHEGRGSSNSRSHSSQSPGAQPQSDGSKGNDFAKGQSEHSATSHILESSLLNEVLNHAETMIPSIGPQSSLIGSKEEAKSVTGPDPVDRNILTTENSTSDAVKESSRVVGKPPKPETQNHVTPSLPYMPYVTTTGNGPNGKTINGFLYRYTKSEVSIICSCHGRSFSPAEFVQHAGVTDVSHPLKHITVISSEFS